MSRPDAPADPPSETLLAGAPGEPVETGPLPAPPPPEEPARRSLVERLRPTRQAPFLSVGLYYLLLIAALAALVAYVPVVRRAFVTPVALPGAAAEADALLTGAAPPPPATVETATLHETVDRALLTLLIVLGALSLVVPVAWVYMYVKRFRYDPALVRSVVILPIVVAGITVVVKNSLALAFSLAGIVAAVRFRNTLKDPRDAVYIFLVIGIGLSAGVQALDVALVMSLAFNLVVLLLWKYNVGSIYSGRYGRTGILSVGENRLLVAQEPGRQREVRRRFLDHAEEMKTDGILLVHSASPERARTTVQEALADMAKDWRLVDITERGDVSTLEYLVRLRKKTAPPDLVGALDERWSEQVAAAEYLPFRTRKKKRKNP